MLGNQGARFAILFLLSSCRSNSAQTETAKNDAPVVVAVDARAHAVLEGDVELPTTIDAPPSIPEALRLLHGLKQQLRGCYNKGLREDPDQNGTLVVSVTIGADRKVSRAEVTKNIGLSPEIVKCAEGVFMDAIFDRTGTDVVNLSVPIRFVLLAPDAGARDPAQWAIAVDPPTLALHEQDKLRVILTLTSLARAPLAPHRDPLEFLVDGKSSLNLDMAFGNGIRENSWTLLEPGKTARDERVGVHFLDAPGDHRLSIAHGGRELASATIHVTGP